MTTSLSLKFFGGLRISWDGITIASPYRSARNLLVFLALQPGGVNRSELARVVCQSETDSQSRNRLRQAIFKVNRLLPDVEFFQSEGQSLRWSPNVPYQIDFSSFITGDSDDFSSCEQGIQQYQGEFLAGEELESGSPFARWVTEQRQKSQQKLAAYYDTLLDHLLTQKQIEIAWQRVRSWIDAVPLSDRAQFWRMRLLVLQEQTQQAIYHYEAFREAKVTQLGQKPSESLTALYTRLCQRGTAAPAASSSSSPPHTVQRRLITVLGIFPAKTTAVSTEVTVEAHLELYQRAAQQVAEYLRGSWRIASDGVLELIFGVETPNEGPQVALRAVHAIQEQCAQGAALFVITHGPVLGSDSTGLAGQVFQELRDIARKANTQDRLILSARLQNFLPKDTASTSPTPSSANKAIAHPQLLEELAQQIQVSLSTGTSQAFWLIGPPGVGKSSLVRQALQSANSSYPILQYQCREIFQDLPLKPLSVTLRQLLAMDSLDPQTARRHLQENIGRIMEPVDPLLLELWSQLLEIDTTPASEKVDLSAYRHLLEESAPDLIAKLVPEPRFVVMEDVHWADASSLTLIEKFLSNLQNLHLIVLITSRGPAPSFAAGPKSTLWQLRPLRDEDAERLLQGLSDASLPKSIRDTWVRIARGLPLYLDSLARTQGTAAAMPDTPEAVIQVSLGSLNPSARRLLQCASIIEDAFLPQQLAFLAEPNASLTAIFEHLLQHAFLERLPSGFWQFRHELLRQGAQNLLTDKEKRNLHGKWAAYLIGQRKTSPAVIAKHLHASGQEPRAGEYYAKASRAALLLGAYRECINLTQNGLVCSSVALTTRRELLADRYFSLRALLGYSAEEVLLAAQELREITQQLDCQDTILLGLHFGQWIAASSQQNISGALLSAKVILNTQYDDIPPAAARAVGLYALGWTEFWQGRQTEAKVHLRQSVDLWSEEWSELLQFATGERPFEAALGYLGLIAIKEGKTQFGLGLFQEAEDHLSPERQLNMWLFIQVMRATMGLWTGDSAHTLQRCLRILAVSSQQGFVLWHTFTLAIEAWGKGRQGLCSAPTALRRIRQHTRTVASVWQFGASILYLAQADLAVQFRLRSAAQIVQHSIRHAQNHGARALIPDAKRLRERYRSVRLHTPNHKKSVSRHHGPH